MARMTRHPTPAVTGYSLPARVLHWLGAAVVLVLIPIGVVMIRLPVTTEPQAATVLRAFSWHKTLGVVALGLTLLRLAVAAATPRPGPLHPDRRAETLLAGTVQALIYLLLVLLPLSGLALNTAAPGYAPLLLPWDPQLPFVPVSDLVAAQARAIHRALAWLMMAALALHLAGAFRHALVDHDATLARITSGRGPAVAAHRLRAVPLLLATVLSALTIALGLRLAPPPPPDPMQAIDSALKELDSAAP